MISWAAWMPESSWTASQTSCLARVSLCSRPLAMSCGYPRCTLLLAALQWIRVCVLVDWPRDPPPPLGPVPHVVSTCYMPAENTLRSQSKQVCSGLQQCCIIVRFRCMPLEHPCSTSLCQFLYQSADVVARYCCKHLVHLSCPCLMFFHEVNPDLGFCRSYWFVTPLSQTWSNKLYALQVSVIRNICISCLEAKAVSPTSVGKKQAKEEGGLWPNPTHQVHVVEKPFRLDWSVRACVCRAPPCWTLRTMCTQMWATT